MQKNGYAIVDFTPIVAKGPDATEQAPGSQYDNVNKKTVILTLKNIGDVLSLQPKSNIDEDIFLQYQTND